MAPTLRNNRWFIKGRSDVIVSILLKGETGPIENERYGEGLMLPLESGYNDQQLADVINYIGLSWNKWRKPLSSSEVEKVRAKLSDRTTPFTDEELQKLQ